MKKWAYYNEFDPKAAAWLRELIKQKLIMDGEVDERSITEVKPNDLKNFIRVGFFAGIGGWDLALQLAGWPADRPVWHGSCPCQPFSTAGKHLGDKDERHLWPVFFDLIRECRPECVFGEQVASAIGKGWLDGVSSDLESEDYACGAAVLGAHSVGAPHIRQRLYWVADSELQHERPTKPYAEGQRDATWLREAGGMGDALDAGSQGQRGLEHEPIQEGRERAQRYGSSSGFWGDFDILPCRDGKTRRIEPGLAPLAYGVSGRVGLLRGYGNAIVPPLAAQFIYACEKAKQDLELL
jgi:DNA (cytosine-5)-methyltransferase 1